MRSRDCREEEEGRLPACLSVGRVACFLLSSSRIPFLPSSRGLPRQASPAASSWVPLGPASTACSRHRQSQSAKRRARPKSCGRPGLHQTASRQAARSLWTARAPPCLKQRGHVWNKRSVLCGVWGGLGRIAAVNRPDVPAGALIGCLSRIALAGCEPMDSGPSPRSRHWRSRSQHRETCSWHGRPRQSLEAKLVISQAANFILSLLTPRLFPAHFWQGRSHPGLLPASGGTKDAEQHAPHTTFPPHKRIHPSGSVLQAVEPPGCLPRACWALEGAASPSESPVGMQDKLLLHPTRLHPPDVKVLERVNVLDS
jgi:hypothetical protein